MLRKIQLPHQREPKDTELSTGYDILNRVTAINYQFAGQTKTVTYGYGKDGQKGESTLLSGATQTTTYDSLGRETTSKVGDLTRETAYLGVSGNRTTALPETLNYTQNGTTLLATSYTYDVRGNIYQMTVDGVTYTYTYDELNQLTEVETSDNSFTATYSYDNGGNITSKTVNGVTTAYGYTDTNWKDKLTSYNGHAISYDPMGNPVMGYNKLFSWTGRQLTAAEAPDGSQVDYTYNADGIRNQKMVHGVVTDYFVDGSTILAEKTGSNIIWYIYDTGGELLGFTCNGIPYYYLKNQQGDVYKIVDANGSVVGSYTYDPWGKVIRTVGYIAEINPIRYRSYYYDSETGLYYLQSRYYDPELGRFINADGLVSTGQGILGNNMYAYCQNNPTIYADRNGYFLFTAIGAVVGAGFGALDAAINGKTGDDFWGAVANGAISGAVTGAAADFIALTGGSGAVVVGTMAIAGAAGSVAGNWVESRITKKELSTKEVLVDAAWDASFGALFGYMAGPAVSSWGQVTKKGFGKYLLCQVQKETGSAAAEEILGNVTAGIGRFTAEQIVNMITNILK